MKKRGGYAGNLEKQIKVRISLDTYDKLQRLSEEKDQTVPRVLRDFIRDFLDPEKTP
jgi:predicted transcriptional regulator